MRSTICIADMRQSVHKTLRKTNMGKQDFTDSEYNFHSQKGYLKNKHFPFFYLTK